MGYTLKGARVNAGYTQTEVSEKLGVGVCAISDWERGKRYPSVITAKKMADLYGVTLNDFIF